MIINEFVTSYFFLSLCCSWTHFHFQKGVFFCLKPTSGKFILDLQKQLIDYSNFFIREKINWENYFIWFLLEYITNDMTQYT